MATGSSAPSGGVRPGFGGRSGAGRRGFGRWRSGSTLRPVRWSRGGLLRSVLVAALLVLAAGVLYSGEPAVSCPPPAGSPAAASPPTAQVPATAADAERTSAARPTLPAGLVGVPIRLAEPSALAFVRPGFRVDLLAAPAAGAGAGAEAGPALLAPKALVLDVVDHEATGGYPALYLALDPDQAQRTVGLPEGTRFAVIVR
ncbi:MAG TPA: flagellar biosynthesis protein FlgA [Micromonospora sp.]|nr:flagellar biosynthesis protein FlgA [Micromonospora sp.]